MDYILYTFNILIIIVIAIVIVKVCMWIANNVGEKLGIGEFIINLWQKIIKK